MVCSSPNLGFLAFSFAREEEEEEEAEEEEPGTVPAEAKEAVPLPVLLPSLDAHSDRTMGVEPMAECRQPARHNRAGGRGGHRLSAAALEKDSGPHRRSEVDEPFREVLVCGLAETVEEMEEGEDDPVRCHSSSFEFAVDCVSDAEEVSGDDLEVGEAEALLLQRRLSSNMPVLPVIWPPSHCPGLG